MAFLTESGRLIELSEWYKGGDILEFFNGRWSKPERPVSSDDEFNARSLSPEEVEKLIKSGRFN